MSKITLLKLNRHFEQKAGIAGISRRDEKIATLGTKSIGNCYICNLPVLVSNGQILQWKADSITDEHLYSHKKCRKHDR